MQNLTFFSTPLLQSVISITTFNANVWQIYPKLCNGCIMLEGLLVEWNQVAPY